MLAVATPCPLSTPIVNTELPGGINSWIWPILKRRDRSYLAEFLLGRNYEVVGMVRRSSTVNWERIAHFQDQITLAYGDLLDEVSLINVLREHRPQEVYNLAAQSFVPTSWVQPVLT